MQVESAFQKIVIDRFRKAGFFVGVGSTTPGFPDLTAIKNNRVILIENKDITGISLGIAARAIFQIRQPPLYTRFIKESGGKIHIAIKNDSGVLLYTVRDIGDIKVILNESLDSMVRKSIFFDSVDSLLDFLTI